MEKRRLGKTDLEIAPLVFGGNVFGWTADEATSFSLLDACIASGINCVDTADVYSRFAPGNQGGESETIIGKWLKKRGRRDDVIIATKVGADMGPGKSGLSKKHIVQAVEDSLKRLQTDYIDLYQSHVDDEKTPISATLAVYEELVHQGKVRYIGASNYKGVRLAQALRISDLAHLPRYQTLQPLYNLYDRADFESDLAPVCKAHGISVITYFSLASGFLTGKYRTAEDFKKGARGAMTKDKLNPRGLRILDALDRVAAEQRATPAQVALAWLMARPTVAAPIVSATSLKQFEDLVKATQLKLSTGSMDALDAASAP